MVSVFPNPAAGVLNVTFAGVGDGEIDVEVRVINLLGQPVYKWEGSVAGNAVQTIEVHDFPQGHYLLKVTADEEKTVHPVMVLR